jgi:hypothetical protein
MEERLNKTTLVSCLFYIGRDKWKYSGFPPGYDRYKNWLNNLLSLNTNLVLFTDDYYYDIVLKTKQEHLSDLKNLHVVKTSIAELDTYKNYYNDISCLMKFPKFVEYVKTNKVAEMIYPLYNVIMFDKVNLIDKASQLDPYNSDYFYWVDAGAFRNEIEQYKDVTWPNSENSTYFNNQIVFYSHRGYDYAISNQKDYFTSQARVVHGGYFIVPKTQISFLKQKVNEVIKEILKGGYIGSDEKIFDLICKRYPKYVHMIKADWFEFYNLNK